MILHMADSVSPLVMSYTDKVQGFMVNLNHRIQRPESWVLCYFHLKWVLLHVESGLPFLITSFLDEEADRQKDLKYFGQD